jgi:FG-GAP-like repeat/Cep192 domain 4/Abnormal spindle-like microcephaly-assoc'd, ASPM-SPD-2-Hydin
MCAAGLTASAWGQFETRASFAFPLSVFPEPLVVASGDFNHDGKLDVAVLSFLYNDIAVMLGNGDGTFQKPTYYTINNELEGVDSIAVADLNGDGNLDLVVNNNTLSSSNVAVLLGNGDGTFQSPVSYATPPAPGQIHIGDFNGDHIPDIAVLDRCTITNKFDCISVLLGNGDGTFREPAITSPTLHPASVMGIGDFNRDGKLDVVTAGVLGTASHVDVLLGNGDGSFTDGATYTIVDLGGNSLTVADFRGNGDLDFAMPGGGTTVAVFLGNGDGTFQAPTYYLVGNSVGEVQAADVNGDGKPDLVLSTSNAAGTIELVGVLLGNGDGTFAPEATYPAGIEPGYAAIGDFNGDNLADLAVPDYRGDTLITLLSTGVVSFSPTTPVVFPTQLVGTTSAPLSTTLTNTGSTTLTISSIRVNGQFQLGSSTTCASSVEPGGNCTLAAVFKPTATGSKAGLLAVVDSASTKPQIIELQGVGTVVSLSPAQLSFPPQKVGTKSTPQTVTVTNTSSTAITFSGAKITGTNWKDFSETNTCGSQIGPGASCTVSVTFAPTTTGTRSAVLNLKDSSGGSPQAVILTGTGT